jgi:uroporphyrinogen decarboxylase
MNDRERFVATMHYQPRDRVPICDFGFWAETIPTWHGQGLPPEVQYVHYNATHTDVFFGMDRYGGGPSANVGLCPDFGWKTLEDRGDHELVQQGDGVVVLRKKFMGSIPHHHSHTLVDRASWKQHYLPKLDPSTAARYPKDWAVALAEWNNPQRAYPATCWGGSLYGWLRDWMGMENLSLVVYDDPAFFDEMITTIGDLIVAVLTEQLKRGARFDGCSMWEDMCYSGGPLLSPEHFKRYIIPHYRRITSLLRSHGCDVIWVDCDGNIEQLMPLWLDAGVNCMFPVEIGTWGADPVKYRKEYGKELLIMGGFDKHILAAGKRQIDAEIRRLTPLVEEGGFIPFADHRVPPDVPLENYLHYLEQARAIWGRGIDLKPLQMSSQQAAEWRRTHPKEVTT